MHQIDQARDTGLGYIYGIELRLGHAKKILNGLKSAIVSIRNLAFADNSVRWMQQLGSYAPSA